VGPAPPGWRRRSTARFAELLPVLFTAQLIVFAGQETIESLAAGGGHLPSVVELLFWGAFGQLPSAAIAAVALTWLLVRLEAAWTVLLTGPARLLPQPGALSERAAPRAPAPARLLTSTFPSAFRKRGPPAASPF
jgi:hypothetical protein